MFLVRPFQFSFSVSKATKIADETAQPGVALLVLLEADAAQLFARL